MNNELLLLSNNDIPFPEAQLTIHAPTLKEISLIGEEAFFTGCQFLNFSKELLNDEDKSGLESKSDFDIFMSIMCSSEKVGYKDAAKQVLLLLFPDYTIEYKIDGIFFMKENNLSRINVYNFDIFKDIINTLFDLKSEGGGDDYNPADGRAAKIAEKLRNAKKRREKAKGGNTDDNIAVFSRFVSILAVGLGKDINSLMNYTVFQIKDEFERFQRKMGYDIYIQAKMAGAQDLDDVDNWMENIHS